MDQPAAGTVNLRSRYTGRARDLFPLYLKTLLLTIVTLGIYRFWARTRIRQHVWHRTVLLDDAMEYTGTGRELFLGFLKAVAALMPLFVLLTVLDIAAEANRELAPVFGGIKVLLYLTLGYLFFVGYYAAVRYRLSRTRWRGIRFGLSGSPWVYGRKAMWAMFLRAITLGLYTPYFDAKLAEYEANNRRFGSEHFRFDGRGGDLFGRFIVCWLLLLPTLGLSWFWYDAARIRYIARHTQFDRLRLDMDGISGWQVARLKLGNFFIALLTLGLFYPVVVRRNMRFWCDRLTAAGVVDFDRIAQTAAVTGTGEGLAGFFDIDAIGG